MNQQNATAAKPISTLLKNQLLNAEQNFMMTLPAELPPKELMISEVPASCPHRWIEVLFLRLGAIYLNKWADIFPTPEARQMAISEWQTGLAGFTGEQIGFGIEQCKRVEGKFSEWPPTLPQFRRLCKQFSKPQILLKKIAYEKKPLSDDTYVQLFQAPFVGKKNQQRMEQENPDRFNRIMQMIKIKNGEGNAISQN